MQVEDRTGRYPVITERRGSITTHGADFATARAQGFQKLAGYLAGGNGRREQLAMMVPVVSSRANGGHEMSFVMPTGRTLLSLPRPDDAAIHLREAPERHVAVMRFRGGYEIEARERELRAAVAKAGLTAFGPVAFAAFDGPTTLGFLRRTELWLEID